MDVLAVEPRLRVQSLLLTVARPEKPHRWRTAGDLPTFEKNVSQSTIANRFGCSLQSISSISSKRMQLEKGLESGGSGHSEKSDRLHTTSERYVAVAKRRTLDVVLVYALLSSDVCCCIHVATTMYMKYAAAEGPGVQDTTFPDVLAKLDIRAGQRAHRGAIEAAQV